MSIALTIHHLRFTAEAQSVIELGAYKGSALRGAWQSHLRTLYCAQQTDHDPLHANLCPVCYLLSREADPSDNRRPYAFEPPLTPQSRFLPGERFDFGLSIYGHAVQFLPYIVLAVQQMGQAQGLGKPIHAGQRGTFRLVQIAEANPLTGEEATLYAAGDSKIQMPRHPVTPEQVERAAQRLAGALPGGRLTLEFLTPTRLTERGGLVREPRFLPLLARLTDRIARLAESFGAPLGAPPSPALAYEERGELLALAARVELVEDRTHWWDLSGHSTRLDRQQPMGGFVGRATYRADEWGPLLPWVVWGASAHVGKNAVKGEGWYRVEEAG